MPLASMVNVPASSVSHFFGVQQVPSGSKSQDPRRMTRGPVERSALNCPGLPMPKRCRCGTRAWISVSVQDTTIPPILLNNTSVRETFSPSSIWSRLKAPSPRPGCVASVVLMKDPNPDPLMGTMSSSPAEVGENDSMVGTASTKSPAVVDTVPYSAQQDPSAPGFGAPRVTTTGPLLALKGTQTSIRSSCQR